MYGNYRGQCIGRLLHFLCEYRMPWYHSVVFDSMGNITLGSTLVADYTWDKDALGNDSDIPTFNFHGKYAELMSRVQAREKADVVARDLMYDRIYGREK